MISFVGCGEWVMAVEDVEFVETRTSWHDGCWGLERAGGPLQLFVAPVRQASDFDS